MGALHASILFYVAIRCYLTKGFDLRAERLLETPPMEHLMVGFMLVYLCYDTFFLLWRRFVLQERVGVKESWSLFEHTLAVVHHFFGFISWFLIYSGTGGVYWAQFIHLAEFSTIIFNVRWIIINEGVSSGPVYTVTSGLFLASFFFSRIPTTAVLLYYMFQGIEQWPSLATAWFHFFVAFGYWCSNLFVVFSFWCANGTKWTWFTAGITSDDRDRSGQRRGKRL